MKKEVIDMERISEFKDHEFVPAIIYNNDSDDLKWPAYGHKTLWVPEGEQIPILPITSFNDYLSYRIGPLAQTRVGALSYCGNFGPPIWQLNLTNISDVGEDPFKDIAGFWTNHKDRLFYLSMRMNDNHHEWNNWSHVWTDFRKESRSLFINPPTEIDWETKILPWIKQCADRPEINNNDFLYDYAKPQVRELYLGIVREALTRYDIDGVELDWLRYPKLFRDGAVSVSTMNEFMEEMHTILEHFSKLRNRHLKIFCRLPETPDDAMAIGLDVGVWLRRGWIDAIIAGHGYTFSSNPVTKWIEMAHQENIPVYGCLERANFSNRCFARYGTPEGLRAAVATLWHHGVDGIYLFNFYLTCDYPLLDSFSNPDNLLKFPKEYFTDSGDRCIQPVKLTKNQKVEVPLVIADDPVNAKELKVEIVWECEEFFSQIPVALYLNGAIVNFLKIEKNPEKSSCYASCNTNTSFLGKTLKKGTNYFLVEAMSIVTILTINIRVVPGKYQNDKV
jgi:hypothetical protein